MLSGFLSILFTVEGIQTANPELYMWSALLIMLAMILDGVDGNLARALNGCSAFGAELDTYVDLTAFGIAPAILIFAVTLLGRNPLWRMVLPSAVALSGVVRLARFKVRDPQRGQKGYAGLPITANATWVALFVLISLTPPRDQFSLDHGPVALLFLLGVLVFITLQVTNVRYPKPTKRIWLFIPCVMLVTLLWGFRLLRMQRATVGVATTIIVLGLGYVILGPLFLKGLEIRRERRLSKLACESTV